jgi:WLM domain
MSESFSDGRVGYPRVQVQVLVNGKVARAEFPADRDESVASLDARLGAELALPTTRKLLFKGRALSDPSAPLSSFGNISSGDKIYVLSSSEQAVAAVKAAVEDPLLRGFSTAKPKFVARPASSNTVETMHEYGFGEFRPLPHYRDADKAKEILESLANDPGYRLVMKARRWRVGCLSEMEPDGKVGVDPVCVLGLNVNKGQEIRLRLRTDDRHSLMSLRITRLATTTLSSTS